MSKGTLAPRVGTVATSTRRIVALALAASLLAACSSRSGASTPSPPGKVGGTPAPDISLVDQFHRAQQLSDYRGKVILLTFISTRCRNMCPLTAQLLTRTEQLLGDRASQTKLIAVNANIVHRSVSDVLRWSRQHRMTHRWLFLTGPLATLESVYEAYGVTPGSAHSVAIFVVDPEGRIQTEVPIAGKKGIEAEAKVLARYVGSVLSG